MQRQVVLLDIFRTLAYCDHPAIEREPIWLAQRIANHRIAATGTLPIENRDDDFLHWSLTTHHATHTDYLLGAEERFNCKVDTQSPDQLLDVLRLEANHTNLYDDVVPTLDILQQNGIAMGMVSNLWQFSADHIVDDLGMGRYVRPEHRVFSYLVGYRKPEDQMFLEACRRFGVRPEDCVMVGDSLESDILGAARLGMRTVLIDREGKYSPSIVANIPRCTYVTSLSQLITVLGLAPQLHSRVA